MHDALLRLIKVALALVAIGVMALMLANCAAAYVADEIPMAPATRAAIDEAKAEWVSQVPGGDFIVRVVVTAVEECNGNYFIRFDDYHWFGKGQGFVQYSEEHGPVGGGTGSGAEELSYWRAWCRP